MGTISCLAQLEQSSPGHDLTAMSQEALDDCFQIQQSRLTVDQRDHVDAEDRFERGVLVQVVQDNLGHFAPSQLDNNPHPVLIGLVAQLGDALDLFLTDQCGNLLDQTGLVYLVGQLRNDDGLFAAIANVLCFGTGAHINFAPTGVICVVYAL